MLSSGTVRREDQHQKNFKTLYFQHVIPLEIQILYSYINPAHAIMGVQFVTVRPFWRTNSHVALKEDMQCVILI